MWKLLLVLVLLIYLLNKISVVLFQAFGRPKPPVNRGGAQENINMNQQGPSTGSGQAPRRGSIKGGEYVDYEEVK